MALSSSDSFDDDQAAIQHCNKSHHDLIKDTWVPCDQCELLLPDSEVNISRKPIIRPK